MGPGFIADKVLPSFAKAEGARVLAVGSNTPRYSFLLSVSRNCNCFYLDHHAMIKLPDLHSTPGRGIMGKIFFISLIKYLKVIYVGDKYKGLYHVIQV